ncbi:hypothetical protein KX928_18720 [Roseobacter sp. YSTF-M11]|uniref:Major facilitator superfamily (MFS) profile domain-containing protein n=1 Tax=Roseobacter insulae TaxID=2859783 RepID=A0A9X1FXY8_9RHOB|nr:MFS transporter [Roseobacter insulae]MBW4709824.1 hypothetical protein [Roseobacter insulae]
MDLAADRRTVPVTLFTLMSAQTLVVAGTLSIPILAQDYRVDGNPSSSWIGIYGSVLFFIAAVATQVSARLVRRFGGFRVSQMTLAFAATGLLAVAVDQQIGLYIAAALFGCAYGQSNTASGSILSILDLRIHRNLVFSAKQSAVPLGGLIAAFYLPLVSNAFGYPVALIGLAVICLLIWVASEISGRLVGLHVLRPKPMPVATGRTPHHRAVSSLVLVFFVLASVQLGFSVTYVGILAPWLDIRPDMAATIFGTAMFVSILLRLVLGMVADHIGSAPVIQIIIFIIVLSLSLLLTSTGGGAAAASVICIAFAFAWNGVLLSEVARSGAPPEQATSQAMTAFFLAGACTPLIIGWSTGFELGLTWVIASLAIAASLALLRGLLPGGFQRRAN